MTETPAVLADDEFSLTAFMDRLGYRPAPFGHEAAGFFACDCGCLMWPDYDDETVYLDRYEIAGGDCAGGGQPCPCHTYPASVPPRNVLVHLYADKGRWVASPPRGQTWAVCSECRGRAAAFVMAEFDTDARGRVTGPRFVCAAGARIEGLPLPEMTVVGGDAMPAEWEQVRVQSEILVATAGVAHCSAS